MQLSSKGVTREPTEEQVNSWSNLLINRRRLKSRSSLCGKNSVPSEFRIKELLDVGNFIDFITSDKYAVYVNHKIDHNSGKSNTKKRVIVERLNIVFEQ